jgi:phosphatidylglycerol:prolipoprotein diacylglycerol transferase
MWSFAGGLALYPKLFTLPEWLPWPLSGFTLHTFGLMVLLGAVAAMKWVQYESKRRGLNDEEIVGVAIEIFLAGLLGTRILFVMQNWDFFADKSWLSLINLREGGLVWYGGPLLALPVIYLRLRNYPVHPLVICDIWAPGLAIGHSIGRLGCFFAGDDYGKIMPEETWYTVTFHSPDALLPDNFRGVPLLPSQPAMFLGVFTIFCILVAVRKKIAHKPAALPALYFTLYPIHRFVIEQFFRGDEGAKSYVLPLVGELRTSAIISIVLFPLGLAAFAYFLRRPDDVSTGYIDWDHAPERVQALRADVEAKQAADAAKAEAAKPKADLAEAAEAAAAKAKADAAAAEAAKAPGFDDTEAADGDGADDDGGGADGDDGGEAGGEAGDGGGEG